MDISLVVSLVGNVFLICVLIYGIIWLSRL